MSALDGDRRFISRHSPEPTLLVSWKVNVDGAGGCARLQPRIDCFCVLQCVRPKQPTRRTKQLRASLTQHGNEARAQTYVGVNS